MRYMAEFKCMNRLYFRHREYTRFSFRVGRYISRRRFVMDCSFAIQ